MICFIGEQTVDETGDGGRGKSRPGGGDELILKFAQVQIEPVRAGGFEQTAKTFDRLEFGAVGRQRE